MAKAIIVEDHQLDHAMKVAGVTGRCRKRDQAILLALFGTALTPTELALLRVDDYLQERGTVRRDACVRAAISYNGRERPMFWVNRRLVSAIDGYLEQRRAPATAEGRFRGLAPEAPLFATEAGQPMAMTRRVVDGRSHYSCDVMTGLIRRLFSQAGIEGASATSGRRTFATKLYRKGYDLRHIQELLGHSSIKAVRRLVECDPLNLGAIVATAI